VGGERVVTGRPAASWRPTSRMWSLRPNASCTTTIPGRGLCLKYEIGHMLARGGGGSIVFTSSATSLRASALLSGAIATPVLGRLADGRRRKRTMIVTLALILAGNILAALAGQFAMLLVGRAAPCRASASASSDGDGGGPGPPARRAGPVHRRPARGHRLGRGRAGLPADRPADLVGRLPHRLLGGTVVALLALLAVAAFVPTARVGHHRPLDLVGCVLITAGLLTLLLAISEGERWHWASGREIGLFAAAVVLLVVWVVWELGREHPLVDPRLLRHPWAAPGPRKPAGR